MVFLILLAGCTGKPNAANIELRKQNQALREQIETLERRHAADAATIRALQESKGTVESLPQERIEQLFTVHGVEIGRLTGGTKRDRDARADDTLKVYAAPTDESGEPIKAAGSLVVELFDLADATNPLIGRWMFDLETARKCWVGKALLYAYVMECPLPRPPAREQLTVRVSFTDLLTGRTFESQKLVRVTAASNGKVPATAPRDEGLSRGVP